MTKPSVSITAKAVRPAPSHLQVEIPWSLVSLLQKELQRAYDDLPGSKPQLATLLDKIEEAVDHEHGVTRVA
jgi:hypothetical protein